MKRIFLIAILFLSLVISAQEGIVIIPGSNNNQQLSIEGNILLLDGSPSINLSPYLDNTDSQTISGVLNGNILTISLENGGSIDIDLSSVVGGGGTDTDDQTASEVPFTATGNTNATNTQAAIEEVQSDVDGKLNTSDNTIASNFNVLNGDGAGIVVTPSIATTTIRAGDDASVNTSLLVRQGNVLITNLTNAAIDLAPETSAITKSYLEEKLNGLNSGTDTDDQTASEVPFTPFDVITATNTQEAIEEIKAYVDGAAGNFSLQSFQDVVYENQLPNQTYVRFVRFVTEFDYENVLSNDDIYGLNGIDYSIIIPPPTGYSINNLDLTDNSNVTFDFVGGEIGSGLDWSITDGTNTLNGFFRPIESATETISIGDISGFADGTVTLTVSSINGGGRGVDVTSTATKANVVATPIFVDNSSKAEALTGTDLLVPYSTVANQRYLIVEIYALVSLNDIQADLVITPPSNDWVQMLQENVVAGTEATATHSIFAKFSDGTESGTVPFAISGNTPNSIVGVMSGWNNVNLTNPFINIVGANHDIYDTTTTGTGIPVPANTIPNNNSLALAFFGFGDTRNITQSPQNYTSLAYEEGTSNGSDSRVTLFYTSFPVSGTISADALFYDQTKTGHGASGILNGR